MSSRAAVRVHACRTLSVADSCKCVTPVLGRQQHESPHSTADPRIPAVAAPTKPKPVMLGGGLLPAGEPHFPASHVQSTKPGPLWGAFK